MCTNFFVFSSTLKNILLPCELNFTVVSSAVLVTAVSSIFSAATAVKTAITAAKADASVGQISILVVSTKLSTSGAILK